MNIYTTKLITNYKSKGLSQKFFIPLIIICEVKLSAKINNC